jgi:RNA polymerase sigma factor (TIGR02999 family)
MSSGSDVTQLLQEWKNGDEHAIGRLTPIVYNELRRLAAYYLRDEHAADTLQPTALVHEAYIRLVAQNMPDWEGRAHFFGVAAHLMRQILVDHARRQHSAKRGAGARVTALDEALSFAPAKNKDLLALNDSLEGLAKIDPRKAKIIELRYFGGFSVEETAQALSVSVATVGREQRLAEAWLHREISRVEL